MTNRQTTSILIVDDDEESRRSLGRILKLDGFAVEYAATVDECLARQEWSHLLAVILDWKLSNRTAAEVLPVIAQRAPHVAVTIVTGYADLDSSLAALREGAFDYLTKPINPEILRSTLKRAQALRAAEDEVREGAERFSLSMLANRDSYWELNFDSQVAWCNDTFREQYGGYPTEPEAWRLWWREQVHPEDRVQALTTLNEVLHGGLERWRGEYRLRRVDGTFATVEDRAFIARDPSGSVHRIVGSVRDVTENHAVLERLKSSETRFRAIFEQSHQLSGLLTPAGILRSANERSLNFSGLKKSEVIGRPFWECGWWSHSSTLQAHLKEAISKSARGRTVSFEATHPRPDGSMATVDFSLRPIFSDEGSVEFLVPESIDITERKRLQGEFLQAQKMEAVGRLSSGIAHDFNNLLAGVIAACRIASSQLGSEHPARSILRDAQNECMRGAQMSRQLLDFSRKGDDAPCRIQVLSVVSNAEKILRRIIGEDIDLQVSAIAPDVTAFVDPGRLEQALMNLAVNARDAMPQGGRLELRIESVALTERQVREGRPAGAYACVSVIDSGEGMDDATQANALRAFFTTKEVGKGTGLGLSSVVGTMDDAGGFLELESRVGKGTSVRLYFPAAEGLPATEALPPEPQPPSQAGSNETILIVEDEYLIRIGTRESLLELGYRVLEAASPAAAVQLVGEGAEAIDLLLSDIVMPGMNGPQLAEKFRTKNPGLRVLFMSAFSALTLEEQGRIAPGVPVLEKPFTDAELAKMVKSSLAHA